MTIKHDKINQMSICFTSPVAIVQYNTMVGKHLVKFASTTHAIVELPETPGLFTGILQYDPLLVLPARKSVSLDAANVDTTCTGFSTIQAAQ